MLYDCVAATSYGMRGFSLIEVITAITILTVGIAGSLALVNRTISATSFVRNQFIAWQLAQEGMEVVHNIRNTNWVENVAWDDGLAEGASFCVNYDSTSLISPCVGTARDLYIVGNRYVHTPGSTTGFSRYIEVADEVDVDGVANKRVQSTVSWGNNTISAEERLYDWR